MFLLCPTSLPTVLPVTDKEIETVSVYLQAGLETDAQVAVIHFVFVDVRMEEAEMACDCEKKVVVVWRELGKFVFK